MKQKNRVLLIIFVLLLGISFGYAQTYDSLIVAPEVLFNGNPPVDMFFKPGRILDNNTIWFCGYISGIFGNETYVFRSVDGGNTFTHNSAPIGNDARAAQMDAFSEDTALVVLDTGKIFRTTDGGTTWNEVYSYVAGGNEWFDGCRVLSENVVVAYGDGENYGEMHFVRSEDKGATWTEITGIDYLGAIYGYFTWGLAACNVGESIWCSAYAYHSGIGDSTFLFRSYDAGLNWSSFLLPSEIVPSRVRSVAFVNDNNGMITITGGSVFKSTDGGANWVTTNTPEASSFPNGVTAIPNSDIIVALDDIGVYYTTDLGTNWDRIATPDTANAPQDNLIGGMFLNPNFGYVFSYNGLVLRFEDQLTSISDPFTSQKPDNFKLLQNYPNPFNPITTIEFVLPKAQFTELKVYNTLGVEVVTLVAANLSQGKHTYRFDGSKLASGVYYYQLKSENLEQVKKMILIK